MSPGCGTIPTYENLKSILLGEKVCASDITSNFKVWHPPGVSKIHKKEHNPSIYNFNLAIVDYTYRFWSIQSNHHQAV
jgi:hypothetical protein